MNPPAPPPPPPAAVDARDLMALPLEELASYHLIHRAGVELHARSLGLERRAKALSGSILAERLQRQGLRSIRLGDLEIERSADLAGVHVFRLDGNGRRRSP